MAQEWDNDIGPLVLQYWGAVRRIYEFSTIKGMSNSTVNTIAVNILGHMLVGNVTANGTVIYGEGGNWANSTAANGLLMACAAGLASNAFVGGA